VFKSTRREYGILEERNIVASKPFEHVSIDMTGPYRPCKMNGHIYKNSFNIIDNFTKYVVMVPTRSMTGKEAAKVFDKYFLCLFPRPAIVTADNGSNFISHEFRELLDSYGIKFITTTVRSPQANGFVERMHGTMNTMLKLHPASQWAKQIASVQWAINSSYHTALNMSPGEAVFGRGMLFNMQPQLTEEQQRITEIQQTRRRYDLKRANSSRIEHTYNVNDFVYLKNETRKSKLDPLFIGPYKITKVNSKTNTVILEQGNLSVTVNIRKIKPS
jgi:hypothetical protein